MYFSLKPHLTEGAILLGLAAFLTEAVDTAEAEGKEKDPRYSLVIVCCLLQT